MGFSLINHPFWSTLHLWKPSYLYLIWSVPKTGQKELSSNHPKPTRSDSHLCCQFQARRHRGRSGTDELLKGAPWRCGDSLGLSDSGGFHGMVFPKETPKVWFIHKLLIVVQEWMVIYINVYLENPATHGWFRSTILGNPHMIQGPIGMGRSNTASLTRLL